MLPAPIDFSDEIYQPSQTLKFVASKGRAFDKYGPTLNYLLMPVYGVSFAYWKLAGQYGRPSGEWPYGFVNPLPQFGTLIFETRLVVLALSSITIGVVARTIRRVTLSRIAALLATLLLLVGNYNVVWHAMLARPDATMLIFLLLAITIIMKIALRGPTRSRAIWLGAICAASAGAKENAGPILAFSMLGLLVYLLWESRASRERRPAIWRCAAWTIASGMITYGATNIAPSPTTWVARMNYWLFGDGLSGDVWARSANWMQHTKFVAQALLNNLGPGGVVVTPLLLIVGLIYRRAITLLLLLPFVGCAFTVYAIPYTPDRFVLPGAASLVFPAALGLAYLLKTRFAKQVTVGCVIAVAANLWWCTITWHINATTEQAMLERAASEYDKRLVIGHAVMFENPPSLRRLQLLGHAVDMRPMQEWVDETKPRPDIVFVNAGRMQMLDEARHMPGRAEYYRHLANFDLAKWPGMEGLGYEKPERFSVPLPGYLKPLSFMPLCGELRLRDLLICRKKSKG